MLYRKIATHCGNDIIERVTIEEQTAYYRQKQNRRKKQERETKVGTYEALLFTIGIFVVWYIGG